ncbi:MAG: DMT family transporter, partial [Chitinophagaceae bacterium]|nr:DMT family transporter [Chitinophagaceae bacterium]
LRSITRLLPLLVAVYSQGGLRKILGTSYPGRHIVRLGVNMAYTCAFMLAMSMGSLTMIYTISYTSALFMVILSALLLKEKVTVERWAAVMLGMVGVVVAMRPGSSVFELASILVLAGACLGSLNKILMRRLAETEHSLSIAIYPNITMILITVPFLLTTWQAMPWSHWGLFAFVGCMTALGQYIIVQALRFTQASVLAPIDYSTFFWVVALDFFWWDKWPDSYTFVGAAIIVLSNLYILYCTKRDQSQKLKQEVSIQE